MASATRLLRYVLFACVVASSAWASMPLETSPAWVSTANSHRATGGAWADVDGDGWIDMVVANGNDMARQAVVIYHNNGDGTLPPSPTWQSNDQNYHGHLDVGDIDGDGLVDVAVGVYIGDGGFSYPGFVKVYLNDGAGGFSALPDWRPAADFYCFSVALGDADGDGDLDLACACGDDYYNHYERQKIFFNNDGTLETTPSWTSDEVDVALDVFWDDVDDDGDMDVAFCGSSTPMRVYRNDQTTGGGIATTATWENTDLPQYGNTTAFGDWNGDGFPELAVADNDQLGGPGQFKVYANSGGTLGSTPAWTSSTGGYGSHVSWIDLDLDGDRDLAAGRWWGAAQIYENTGGTLTTSAVWNSATESVIENMFWGDVDNDALHPDGVTMASGDGNRTFFRLGHAPVRSINAVFVNGLPTADYVAHPGNGWVSIGSPPANGVPVAIEYTYSTDVDLGITNWDSGIGNYLFLNTGIVGVPDVASAIAAFRAHPNPLRARTMLRYRGEAVENAHVAIFDVGGRQVRTLHDGPLPQGLRIWEWDGRDNTHDPVAAGVYYARLRTPGASRTLKLVLLQ